MNIDKAFIGRLIGVTALGYYSIAYNWANRVVAFFSSVINRVIFPAYSKMQDQKERLKQGYLKSLKYIGLVIFPVSFGLLAIAPEFVVIVLGEKWALSIVPLQILCIAGVVRVILDVSSSVFLATGKTALVAKSTVIGLVLIIVFVYPFAKLWGIIGVSLAVTSATCISGLIVMAYTVNILNIKISSIFKALVLPASASVVMVMAVWAARYFFSVFSMYLLVLLITVGVLVYLSVLLVLTKGELFNELRELFLLMIKRAPIQGKNVLPSGV